jgi:hypothetical protein
VNRPDLHPAVIGYAVATIQGLFAFVAPRRSIRLSTLGTRLAFDDTDDLSPRPWLVRATRITGFGTFVAGRTGVVVELRTDPDDPTPALADVLPGGADD